MIILHRLNTSASFILQKSIKKQSKAICPSFLQLAMFSKRPQRINQAQSSSASRKFNVEKCVHVVPRFKTFNRDDLRAAFSDALGEDKIKAVDSIIYPETLQNRGFIVEVDSAKTAKLLINQKTIPLDSGYIRTFMVDEDLLTHMNVGSDLNLDERAIRIFNTPWLGVDEVAFFFRDYDVRQPDGIRQVVTQSPTNEMGRSQEELSFIVMFNTADEAQRALREKQDSLWASRNLRIVPFK